MAIASKPRSPLLPPAAAGTAVAVDDGPPVTAPHSGAAAPLESSGWQPLSTTRASVASAMCSRGHS